jgi:hypothetical protein
VAHQFCKFTSLVDPSTLPPTVAEGRRRLATVERPASEPALAKNPPVRIPITSVLFRALHRRVSLIGALPHPYVGELMHVAMAVTVSNAPAPPDYFKTMYHFNEIKSLPSIHKPTIKIRSRITLWLF